jgi:hypothetical protein
MHFTKICPKEVSQINFRFLLRNNAHLVWGKKGISWYCRKEDPEGGNRIEFGLILSTSDHYNAAMHFWNIAHLGSFMMFTACLALALPKLERSNISSGLIRNSYLLSNDYR